MAQQNKDTRQVYAEFIQDRDNIKQVVQEHTDSGQFRECNRNFIREYHGSDEYREKQYGLFEEYMGHERFKIKLQGLIEDNKTSRIGKLLQTNCPKLVWIIITAILAAFFGAVGGMIAQRFIG